MKGEILDYDIDADHGLISAEDGSRYTFRGMDVRADRPPKSGDKVDFQTEGGEARDIYVQKSAVPSDGKSKVVAGLLAIFVGALGIHKFYLGYSTAGVIMLAIFVLGWILLGIPSIIISFVAFVEGIIYLVRSDEEFHERYVENRRAWF